MIQSSSTEIDPAVDEIARLWEVLCRTQLGIQKLIIDRTTQHCHPQYVPVFRALLRNAEQRRVTPRQLIDSFISGTERMRRRDPTFIPRTERLIEPEYRRFLARGRWI